MRREAPDDAVGAPDEDEVLSEGDAVGRGRPQLDPLVEQPPVVELAEQPSLGDGVRAGGVSIKWTLKNRSQMVQKGKGQIFKEGCQLVKEVLLIFPRVPKLYRSCPST